LLFANIVQAYSVEKEAVKDFTTNFFTQAQNLLFSLKTEIAIVAHYLDWIKLTLMTWSLVAKTLAKVLSNQKPSTLMFLVWPETELSVFKL
jgi:hypothetical protein